MDHASHVSYVQAIILGLLQGLTEFLPVSSTAHMDIAPQLFFGKDPGAAFSAIVQLGPIIAIITYFRDDLVKYIHGIIRRPNPNDIPADDIDAKLGWYVLFATIPILIFGFLLQKQIETVFRSLYVVSFTLIVLAIILFWAEKVSSQISSLDSLTWKQSQIIGWAQVLALVPGTSRSGVTITAGLFQGLNRESAARFSFLLSIPSITAAGLWETYKVLKVTHLGSAAGPDFLAAAVAGAFAYIVIKWFLGYMKEHNTTVFVIYRIALGVALLFLLHFHIIKSSAPDESPKPISVTVSRQAQQ